MTASSAWFSETASFFGYLRSRGWLYALLRFGPHLESMHHFHAPRAANDNRPRS